MILEPLTACIEQAKERIDQHGPLLRGSEALTRYVLIDPLLRALGWDTANPELVIPEDRGDRGASGLADYALLSGGRRVALLEAKKLGERLDQAVEQALNYCNARGIGYMLVSDGDRWAMYKVFHESPIPIEERRIVDLSLLSDTTQAAALKLLHFWQPNLGGSSGITAPPAQPEPPAANLVSAFAHWTPLSQINPGINARRPISLRFPGGETRSIKSWRDVLLETAGWLVNNGTLTAQQLPIRGLGFIQSEPKSARDSRQVSEGVYVNTNMGAERIVDSIRNLLNHFRINPETVELSFE